LINNSKKMKTLGKKSLSAIIATIINIIWWLEWAGCIAVIALTIIAGHIRKVFAFDIPITFTQKTIAAPVVSISKDFPDAILNTTSGDLFFPLPGSWQNMLIIISAVVLVFAGIATITYQLKVIFSNFSNNLPFNELNISRIRNIAFVLMAYSILQWVVNIGVNQILIRNINWKHMQLTYSFNISFMIMGILLIIVAEVFKLGTSLEEEKNLTI